MFERGLKRHSYQLWEVKFQCPAKESAAETEQRLSSQLARYILPSRGPSPSTGARCPNLRPPRRTPSILLHPPPYSPRPSPRSLLTLSLSPFLFSFFFFRRISTSFVRSFVNRVSSGRFLVQIKLIFKGPTLFSYEFHIGAGPRDPWNGDVFTCRSRSRDARLHPGPAAH